MRIGFHASHEQISPRQLLRDVHLAERVGFQMAMCSDHFSPWSERQGHSGYAWSWLGAALATTELSFGCVCAPGQRYHPAILAQKIATLAQMFPGRVWASLGSGEALNEHITGDPWPTRDQRTRRLEECVDVIRRLLAGEEVSHAGLITVDRARLWDLPDKPIPLIAPVVTVESAARVAAWGDGLITINQDDDRLRAIIDAYRSAGGRGPVVLQIHLSWAPTRAEAEEMAWDQWRTNVFAPPVCWDLDTVQAFDTTADHVTLKSVAESVEISADLGWHRDRLQRYADLGFDDLYLHHVGQDQSAFLKTFGARVLPDLIG